MFDSLLFAKRRKLIDRLLSAPIFLAQQSEYQAAKFGPGNVNPEFIVTVPPDFLDARAHVVGIQTHRIIGVHGQVD